MNDNYYDPNAHLDPEIRYRACQYSLHVFHRARVKAHELQTGAPNSFMLGLAGERRYLVYVRVTLEDEQEQGTGPMPGILIDTARELDAEPHVVRVHLRRTEQGTDIEYFGHKELEREFKRGEPWSRLLLRGKTARDYLKLVGGRLSQLQLTVRAYPPGQWPEPSAAERATNELLDEILGESENKREPEAYRGSVRLELRVDTLTPKLSGLTINMGQLVRSTAESDEFYILTCTCGVPECAGIWRGIEVVHGDGLVVWRVRGIRPRRVAVFAREPYRREILSKVREVLALHQGMGEGANLEWALSRSWLEAALYDAEETPASGEPSESTPG